MEWNPARVELYVTFSQNECKNIYTYTAAANSRITSTLQFIALLLTEPLFCNLAP